METGCLVGAGGGLRGRDDKGGPLGVAAEQGGR